MGNQKKLAKSGNHKETPTRVVEYKEESEAWGYVTSGGTWSVEGKKVTAGKDLLAMKESIRVISAVATGRFRKAPYYMLIHVPDFALSIRFMLLNVLL